jgi:hypothetical protein
MSCMACSKRKYHWLDLGWRQQQQQEQQQHRQRHHQPQALDVTEVTAGRQVLGPGAWPVASNSIAFRA